MIQDSTFHCSAHSCFTSSSCNDKNSQILPPIISISPQLCLFPFHRVHCGAKFRPGMYFSPAKFQSLRAYPCEINFINVDVCCGYSAIFVIKSAINSRNLLESNLFCYILMAAMLLVPHYFNPAVKCKIYL